MSNTSSRRLGFSLIELLVVIAIISLLVSLTLPSLKMARETAGKLKCGSNARQITYILIQYATDHKDWGPGPNAVDNYYNSYIRYGVANVLDYFPNRKILICPGQDQDWLLRTTMAPGTLYQPTSNKYLVFGYRIYFGWGNEATDPRNIYGWTVTGSPTPQYTETNHTYRVPPANMRFYGRILRSPNGSTCFVDQPSKQAMTYDVFNPSGGQMHMPGFFVDSSHVNEGAYGLNVNYADGHGEWKKPEQTVRRFQNFDFPYW